MHKVLCLQLSVLNLQSEPKILRLVQSGFCPGIFIPVMWHDIRSSPRSPLHSSFHPGQWPPASGQTGPSVKSDPISKPFVRTFYVQQFLFVFVVPHSSSVLRSSHAPWLGHLSQKSQASSNKTKYWAAPSEGHCSLMSHGGSCKLWGVREVKKWTWRKEKRRSSFWSQKSQASSENITLGQIFIETRS